MIRMTVVYVWRHNPQKVLYLFGFLIEEKSMEVSKGR